MTLLECKRILIEHGKECVPVEYRTIIELVDTANRKVLYLQNCDDPEVKKVLDSNPELNGSTSCQLAKKPNFIESFNVNKNLGGKSIVEIFGILDENEFLEKEKIHIRENIDAAINNKDKSIFKLLVLAREAGLIDGPPSFALNELLNGYKAHIRKTELKDELYKWELIKDHQGRPDVSTFDFKTEINDIKFLNLVYAMGIAVLRHLTNDFPEDMRAMFKELFDEHVELGERVRSFNAKSMTLFRQVEDKLQHHQDERSIATYLTFFDSEKYTLYKSSFYRKYCKLLGIQPAKTGQRYVHYLSLVNDLIKNHIEHDAELIGLVKKYLPNYYDGSNHLLLAQDILYQMIDKEDESITDSIEKTELIKSMAPLNQILYGPSGTGKTYHSINRALSIIEGVSIEDLNKESREQLTTRFKQYQENGQIVFTTFHQSMSYEDFVEGIKPDENDGQVTYSVKDGIFKSICTKAKSLKASEPNLAWEGREFFKMSLGGKNSAHIHSWCIENNKVALGWGGTSDLSEFENCKTWEEHRDKYVTKYPDLVKESKYNTQATRAFMRMKPGAIVIASLGNHIIDAIGVVDGPYEFDDANEFGFHHLRSVKWIVKDMNTSPERFFKKNISQQTIYEFYSKDVKVDAFEELTTSKEIAPKPHVLVIDEINRGNVSAIFGELITLLEDDKRIGNKEEIELMLPYSKTKFGVPNNVYIIGTMNTADRSVEALDTALRRRFLFTEVAPMPQLIQSEGSIEGELMVADKSYDLTEILGLINKRIEVLLDKDHMIGHSFFLKVNSVDDLKMTFGKNIIPLLQEYFFGDYGKISLVLGEGFCKGLLAKEGFSGAVFSKVSSGYESEMFLDKLIYTIYDPILDLSDDNKFAEALDKLLNR